MITTAIIIPYFQKNAGILRRALNSVLQQQLSPNVQVDIIVVDDGSPVSARTEVEGLSFEPPYRLTLIEQPNGGVAAARNAGLDHVSEETAYIAFLDSDDMWERDHLATALATLEKGYDFYFCDSRRTGENYTSYSERNFDNYLLGTNARAIGDQLFELGNKPFFTFSLRSRPFMIPTVVYRRSIAPKLTFDIDLRVAGEDCLFLFTLLTKSKKISCSSRELVAFGDGVNIYADSYSWDNPRHLMRHMGIILSLYKFKHELPLTNQDIRFYVLGIKKTRKIFAFLSIRYLLRKKELWPKELVRMTQSDPAFWFWYIKWALYILVAYPLKIYNPVMEGDIFTPNNKSQQKIAT